jgi:hypothetical protein
MITNIKTQNSFSLLSIPETRSEWFLEQQWNEGTKFRYVSHYVKFSTSEWKHSKVERPRVAEAQMFGFENIKEQSRKKQCKRDHAQYVKAFKTLAQANVEKARKERRR